MNPCAHTLTNSNFSLSMNLATKKATIKVIGIHTPLHGELAPATYTVPADVDARYDLVHDTTSTQPSGTVEAEFTYSDVGPNNRAKCRVRNQSGVFEIWMDQLEGVFHVLKVS